MHCAFLFSLSVFNQIKLVANEGDSAVETNVSTRKTKKHRTNENRIAAAENDLGFVPEEILGASEADGKIRFRIKVKDSETWKIFKARKAHAACPELVMDFYEKHLFLEGEPLYRND